MYLEDVFTEKMYQEIKSNLENRVPFEKKLIFGKYTYTIELDKLKHDRYYMELWGELFMVGFDYKYKDSGGSYGEKVVDVLSNFGTYQEACAYLHNETHLNYAAELEPKYQGVKYGSKGEQITMF